LVTIAWRAQSETEMDSKHAKRPPPINPSSLPNSKLARGRAQPFCCAPNGESGARSRAERHSRSCVFGALCSDCAGRLGWSALT
jgi:hypothetical protein